MDLITVTREEGLRFSIQIRHHVMTTDMSVKDGGKDGGPAPVEIMGASMGACLATLVQAYCDTRGYTDGDVAVSLTIEMVDNPNRVGGFVADIELPKDVPETGEGEAKKDVPPPPDSSYPPG